MRWLERIQLFIRTTLHDLLSEEPYAPPDRVQTVLTESQSRLITLRQELDQALAREKRAKSAYQKARATAEAQQKQVDEWLQKGEGAAAASLMKTVLHSQQQAEQAQARYQTHVQATAQLRQIMQMVQEQMERVHQQDGSLADQQDEIVALERLNQLRREQRHSLSTVHRELAIEAEELARRKDRLSAHQDLEEKRLREDWE
jgi:phage shock protein A